MTDLAGYYDTSYPASLWYANTATAGIPGTWTPAGSQVPRNPTELSQGYPGTVTAVPATAWTTGQYVQTQLAGVPGRATWTGTNWVSGAAPLEAEAEKQPEPLQFEAIPVDRDEIEIASDTESPPDTESENS